MKLGGLEVSDQVYAAHLRVCAMSNDEFYPIALGLGLDVGNGMPKYRGPSPYWWETDQLSDNAQRFQASRGEQ